MRAWLAEALDELFFLGGKVPRTLKALISSPGLLMVEWEAGRRAKYLRPLRLFLFALALGVLYQPLSRIFLPAPGNPADSDLAFQSVLLVLSVPGLAVLTRVVLIGTGPRGSLLPYLVFSLHTHAAALLIFLVVNTAALPLQVAQPDLVGMSVYTSVPLAALAAYLIVSLRRWACLTWFGAVARGVVIGLAYVPLGFVMIRGINLVLTLTQGTSGL